MRVLVLLIVLLSTPLLALAQSPAQIQQQQQLQQQFEQEQLQRYNQQRQLQQQEQLEQQRKQDQQQKYPRETVQRRPGDYCCRHCRANELPCGNSCLPPGGKKVICEAKATCACSGKP